MLSLFMLAKICDSFVIYHTPFSFQHYLVATCRVAATDTTMRSELHSFAKQLHLAVPTFGCAVEDYPSFM